MFYVRFGYDQLGDDITGFFKKSIPQGIGIQSKKKHYPRNVSLVRTPKDFQTIVVS